MIHKQYSLSAIIVKQQLMNKTSMCRVFDCLKKEKETISDARGVLTSATISLKSSLCVARVAS
jgi:hypothetical protein